MTKQPAYATFNALIVANNTVESADLAEFLELNRFGPVAQVVAADEAAVLIRDATHIPSVVVLALSMDRAGNSGFLDMIADMRAPVIWIDAEPDEMHQVGAVSIRRPYSEGDLKQAIASLAL